MRWCALLLASSVTGVEPARAESPPRLTLPRIARAPDFADFLDAEPSGVLERSLAVAEGFIQGQPRDGEPAELETRVHAGYDENSLYFVFVCLDDQPRRVRSRLTRREGTSDYEDDMVEVRIDTFHDRRRSFYFAANPAGVQLDSLWPEVGGDFDESFDTVWRTRGERTEWGYLVLMEIPFRSLRFPSGRPQRWGIYYGRWNPRLNEKSFWPRVSEQTSSLLSQMAGVDGLAGISPGRNIQLIPYGSLRGFETIDDRDPARARRIRDPADVGAGLDGKLVVADALALDLTANPDFSQVESDEPQVTANQRFEVFFPEKRPFFLENANFFRTPLDLVFTRRIVDPGVGARVTGKAGPWAFGALLVDDEAPGRIAGPGSALVGERAGIGVARVARDVFAQSSVGAIYTERRLAGGHNRVGGVDARLQLGRHWSAELQAVSSASGQPDGATLDGPAYRAVVRRDGLKLGYRLDYDDVGAGFRSDLGFVPRAGFRRASQRVALRGFPGTAFTRWAFVVTTSGVWDRAGRRLDWELTPVLTLSFRRRSGVELSWSERRERLTRQEFIDLASELDFAPSRARIDAWSSPFAQLSFGAGLVFGRGVNFSPPSGTPPREGDLRSADLAVTLRPIPQLELETRYLRTTLDDPAGARVFRDEILRSRLSLQLTRRLSVRTIVRYDSIRSDESLTTLEARRGLNLDLLITFLVHPGTAAFVGYTHDASDRDLIGRPPRLLPVDGLRTGARQLFVKVSYLFRF